MRIVKRNRLLYNKKSENIPGVCDNPLILNLHFRLWDFKIVPDYVRPPWSGEDRSGDCEDPPGSARTSKLRKRHFGVFFHRSAF